MWIHLLILGVTLGFGTAYNFDMASWYDSTVLSINGDQVGLCVQAVFAACLLVLVSIVMVQTKAYSLMLLMAKLVLEINLFAISMLAFGSVYFSWILLKNVWLDMGVALSVPFIGVVAAGICLQIFDFNYPYMQKILGYLIVCIFSIAFVFLRVM